MSELEGHEEIEYYGEKPAFPRVERMTLVDELFENDGYEGEDSKLEILRGYTVAKPGSDIFNGIYPLEDSTHDLETDEFYVDDVIGVMSLEKMPNYGPRYFVHVLPADTPIQLDNTIKSMFGNRSKKDIILIRVKRSLKDNPNFIVMFYSPYLSHVMVQNGGTCYYHTAVNAIIFNPYFTNYFYNESFEPTKLLTRVKIAWKVIVNGLTKVDPSKLLESDKPQDQKNKLVLASKNFFDHRFDDISYDKCFKHGGYSFLHMFEIVDVLFIEKPDRVSVDIKFKEIDFINDKKFPEVWFKDPESDNFVDGNTVLTVQRPITRRNRWLHFTGFSITSVIYDIHFDSSRSHAVVVFRDDTNGLCLLDSNYTYILPLKSIDKELHDAFLENAEYENIGGTLDALVSKVYGLRYYPDAVLDSYVIQTRVSNRITDKKKARVDAVLPERYQGGGFKCNAVAIALGALFTMYMSTMSVV